MGLIDVLKTFDEDKVIVQDGPKYTEKDAEGLSLKGVLQRGRLKLGRESRIRVQGLTFRPSTITFGYCRRAKIGQLAGVLQLVDESPRPRQQLVFDVGNAYHDIIQRYFWDIGVLRGSYKCIKCDKIYHNLVSPTTCPSGIASHGRSCLKYKEVICRNEEYLISGRCDGILAIADPEHVMDIKSIANRTLKTPDRQFCFEDLVNGPKPDHVVQVNLYLWIFQLKMGHLLYVAKNDQQIKTFAIPYDYNVIRPYLEEIKRLIETANALKRGERVELPQCCDKEACQCHTILSKLA